MSASEFASDKPGIEIRSDGYFDNWANVGWCGTPPVTYGHHKGTWTLTNDDKYFVDVPYWGGRSTFNLKVVDYTGDELVVVHEYLGH